MKIVQFVEESPPYTTGEKAGFDDGPAAKFVARGAARYVDDIEGSAPVGTPVIVPNVNVGDGDGGTPTVSSVQPNGDGVASDAASAGTPDFDAMTDDALRDLIEQRDGRRPNAKASRETLLEKVKGTPTASEETE